MGYDMEKPGKLPGKEYSFDSFDNGQVLLNKKKKLLNLEVYIKKILVV